VRFWLPCVSALTRGATARSNDARERQASVAVPGRLELPTFGLGNRCSIRLSYGTIIWLRGRTIIIVWYAVNFRGATATGPCLEVPQATSVTIHEQIAKNTASARAEHVRVDT
jgi:hypothetical protein